ncbi:hypothetical protein [Rhodomicrobium udaipurense]|uniref:Uncharacterized protein n=1 Tax=Rhodomicrobium udaipurense TaxID=1202716 RepID=A0A8I1GA25_9HYPH|nr:hypothetical protein [Rhodomicrobium udaipurense]MBJ7543302.1 hypothetical protein [Rhodomicrobium udaipurense]
MFGWFAHAVGKSIVAEAFGKLVSPHYFLVDHPRYVTGQFNAHMAGCLFLLILCRYACRA